VRIKDRPEYHSKLQPVTLRADNTVQDAIMLMCERNFGSIIITNEQKEIEGIITERDMLTRILYKSLDPKKTKISDVMTSEVRVAKEDDLVVDWLRIMSNDRFRHLPIVNNKQELVSIMSQGDFVSYTWPEILNRIKSKAAETVGAGHQVILIVVAMLLYALVVGFMV